MGLGVAGQADLYVNGEKVVDNSNDQKAGLLFVRRSHMYARFVADCLVHYWRGGEDGNVRLHRRPGVRTRSPLLQLQALECSVAIRE